MKQVYKKKKNGHTHTHTHTRLPQQSPLLDSSKKNTHTQKKRSDSAFFLSLFPFLFSFTLVFVSFSCESEKDGAAKVKNGMNEISNNKEKHTHTQHIKMRMKKGGGKKKKDERRKWQKTTSSATRRTSDIRFMN